MRRAFIAVPFVLLVSAALPASHVRPQAGALESKASVGLKPLTEMTANDRYKGEDGGLDLIRIGGHLPKGGYDVQTNGRQSQAAAQAAAVRF